MYVYICVVSQLSRLLLLILLLLLPLLPLLHNHHQYYYASVAGGSHQYHLNPGPHHEAHRMQIIRQGRLVEEICQGQREFRKE